ncbi:hypothetical protein [Rhizobium rhizosphaerae]|uniref:hypothetical protein n=1 Tax=Xaviernesmea rhizosphaerae TaxID=1672749 RepID=UPI00159353BA|nr:hypothetical protein [Xaviernesmea rhizosphaerae]
MALSRSIFPRRITQSRGSAEHTAKIILVGENILASGENRIFEMPILKDENLDPPGNERHEDPDRIRPCSRKTVVDVIEVEMGEKLEQWVSMAAHLGSLALDGQTALFKVPHSRMAIGPKVMTSTKGGGLKRCA